MASLHLLLLFGVVGGVLAATNGASAQSEACNTNLSIELPKDCKNINVSHPIGGLSNFRELTTPDSGIKRNTLFRSDQLDKLTKTDIAKLSKLGLETVVDLRAQDELVSHPNKHISSVDFTINTPIGADPADIKKIMPLEIGLQIRPLWFEGKFDEIDKLLEEYNVNLREIRKDRYRDFATKFNPQVSRFLRVLTNEKNFPLLFHCAGGKDRTGYIAAVTLLTLGYTKDDVMRDYLATNIYTYQELKGMVSKGPKSLRPSFGAHPEQINAALDAIKDEYGSFVQYRRDILGISDEEVAVIRKNLLIDR